MFSKTFCFALAWFTAFVVAGADVPLKQHSALFGDAQIEKIRRNISKTPWATDLRNSIVTNATPWMERSDDDLWDSIFGAAISRSWQVWSDGYCPACKKSVEMYNWKMDAWNHPWKVQCPNCQEFFPKNDFQAFYHSGLDEHGIFDPKRADRSLLFNAEHPDPKDPLHNFGVDDGEGYVDGKNRWRFIGTYLIFGHWHQRILCGIDTLAAAYVVTGDRRYAHKAGVLLDRIADVYPTFDFMKQGYVYEKKQANGYISVWHDTSEETYEMTIAYDEIFEGIRDDQSLVDFLSAKADKYKPANPKQNFTDIQRNIETRILRDALAHPEKIYSNFPRQQCTATMINTVLAWPENRQSVEKMIDTFVRKATAVDGLTGEKGLAGYTAYDIATMARFLNEYVRTDPTFLSALLKRNPALLKTYRFHIDTHCLGEFYPSIGDTGGFETPNPDNPVMLFSTFGRTANLRAPLAPSMYSFFWQFYRETGDPAYVQQLYVRNKNSVKDLPYDIFEDDPKSVQRAIAKVIRKNGPEPKVGSVNKQAWHLGILRSGQNENARALWLAYDSGGPHGHANGMNLGLFGYGLDLLPDFGYPPVQFGGWTTPRAIWYKMTAAHNTVVVDGHNDRDGAGKTTLWADSDGFHAIRASAPAMAGGKQYERTAALIDISDKQFYVADIFRVDGGSDHAKFTHSLSGTLDVQGLNFRDKVEYANKTQTRAFQRDPEARAPWTVTWNLVDHHKLATGGKQVQLRYTDLTDDAQALVGEAWVVSGLYGTVTSHEQMWIPCVISRRQGPAPLTSTFVSVIEPFTGKSAIKTMHRLPLQSAGTNCAADHVAIEVDLTDGRRDLLIAANTESPTKPSTFTQPDWNVEFDGDLCWIRKSAHNKIERIGVARTQLLTIDGKQYTTDPKIEFTQLKP